MNQQKVTESGLKTWQVDTGLITRLVNWAGKDPDRLYQELAEMEQPVLQTFIVTVANEQSNDVMICPECKDIFVFWDNDIRCVNCERGLDLPRGLRPRLTFLGQLANPIGRLEDGNIRGRPFLKDVFRRVSQISDTDPKKHLYQSYFFTLVNEAGVDHIWFSPAVIAIFPENWPRSAPDILFRDEYFKILNIPATHTYGRSGNNHKLCNFSSWHRSTMARVLQQRIVPRVLIDIMFSDLKSVGKMEEVLRRIVRGGNLFGVEGAMYRAYNMIGRQGGEHFRELYNQYVSID